MHQDHCEVCNEPGEVLCCATCSLVFHIHCFRPKLPEEPPNDWMCAYCCAADGKKDGKERHVAKKACREMERMMRDIKEKVRKRAGGGIMNVESDHEESNDDDKSNEDHKDKDHEDNEDDEDQ